MIKVVVALFLTAWGTAYASLANPPQVEELVATCAACHGENGASSDPTFPNIGGQSEAYLRAAMKWFRSGEHPSTSMGTLMKDYGDEQIAAVAKYYASQRWTAAPQQLDEGKIKRGMQLAVKSTCAKCHGETGETTDEETPRIGGQWAPVLEKELSMYKDGRIKVRDNLMQPRLKGMKPEDLAALAEYFASLK